MEMSLQKDRGGIKMKSAVRNTKKIVLLIMSFIILASFVSAFEVHIYDKDNEESYLFVPGSFMRIEADTESAQISLVYNKQIQIFSANMVKEDDKAVYEYDIPQDMKKGNYDIVVLNEDEKKEKEIIIGNIVKMNFVEPTEEVKEKIEKIKLDSVSGKENNLDLSGEKEITDQINKDTDQTNKDDGSLIRKMLNNIWVNYIWIKE